MHIDHHFGLTFCGPLGCRLWVCHPGCAQFLFIGYSLFCPSSSFSHRFICFLSPNPYILKMRPACTLQARLRSRLVAASAARFVRRISPPSGQPHWPSLRVSWGPQGAHLGISCARALGATSRIGWRSFASGATSESPSSNISFEPEEVGCNIYILTWDL